VFRPLESPKEANDALAGRLPGPAGGKKESEIYIFAAL
jgi:hypothetical protein